MQNLLRERAIEELDERAQAEGTDQGADADQAAQQEGDGRTECIGKDAAAEVRLVQVVLQGQSQRIVRCNAQVGRLVQRAAKRCDRHGDHDPQQLDGQLLGRAEPARNDVVEKSDDEPTAQAVDQGAQANVLAAPDEFHHQEQQIGADVLHAQRDAQQLGQADVQGRDGIIAQVGLLEDGNAQRDDDDADHHTQDTAHSRTFRFHGFLQLSLLDYKCRGLYPV